MSELVKIFTEAGCSDVRTYIQSGNVLFAAPPTLLPKLPSLVSASIVKRFGYEAPVIIRTVDELGEIIRANPFRQAGVLDDVVHVLFLADRPNPATVEKLDAARSAPDAFIVRGQEIYLHLPNGVARTKLTNAYFDAKLGMTTTLRNSRTVAKLWEMGRCDDWDSVSRRR
jgi:uncharacterized protein (DUF1697 family)